jgi:protein-disulfide isomerase
MASRTEQKAAARAARVAAQKQQSTAASRRQRLIVLGGLLAVVVVALVIVIAVGGGGTKKTSTTVAKTTVAKLLKGIPQNGNVLGKASAPVTVTEYGDLVCPICKDFAQTSEQQLIANEVRAGKVKLVYRALETASGQANNGEFVASQVAARAAGAQGREWNYILVWYQLQQDETTPYVTDPFMQNIAQQIPGLNLSKWQAARNNQGYTTAVAQDASAYNALNLGQISTPTVTFNGPKGTVQPISGVPTYAGLQADIASVS